MLFYSNNDVFSIFFHEGAMSTPGTSGSQTATATAPTSSLAAAGGSQAARVNRAVTRARAAALTGTASDSGAPPSDSATVAVD